jgi:hypothetical protein
MPIIPDIVDIGFSGFQGFQYEFDIDPYKLREFVRDRPPLFFAGAGRDSFSSPAM